MAENGTFIALITINLGGIGLLATFILANYFFYSERIGDLTTSIITEAKTVKLKISSYMFLDDGTRSEGVYGKEYVKKLQSDYHNFFKLLVDNKISKMEGLKKISIL